MGGFPILQGHPMKSTLQAGRRSVFCMGSFEWGPLSKKMFMSVTGPRHI
jgi:hypothetical protein